MNLEKVMDTIINLISIYALKFIAAVLIIIIGKWLSRKISNLIVKLLEKNKVDATLIGFSKSITYYTLLIVVLIAAAGQLGINTTSLLTIVGAAGLAVGLALKDSLSNFASGAMLILFRPFNVGDFVDAGGVAGTVERITFFNTIFKTPDNKKIIAPNSSITGSVITNNTANPTRRVDMVAGIGYDDDIAKTKEVLLDLVKADPRILSDPAPKVALSELADSSVNFVVRPWVKTEDYWDVYFDLTEQIKIAFDKEGISIPYPQQDVHLFTEQAVNE